MSYDISVIIPCYNKENSLQKTLDSLIAQTIFNRMEIICIDDCSTDNTYDELKKYSYRYKDNIFVYKHEKNSSVFVARKTGIIKSRGCYIGWVDPDDWVEPTYFEELWNNRFGPKNEEIDIIQTFSVYKHFSENTNRLATNSIYKNHSIGIFETDINNDAYTRFITNNWNTVWNKLFKRSVILPYTYLPDYRVNLLEDVVIVWISCMNATAIKNIETTSYYYYDCSNNVSHLSKSRKHNQKCEYFAIVFHILNSYIVGCNKYNYYPLLIKYRKNYLLFCGQHFPKAFNNRNVVVKTETDEIANDINNKINNNVETFINDNFSFLTASNIF